MSSSTKDQLPASASEMAAAPPAASNSTPVIAPPTQDAQPKSIALHQNQQEDIQRDLHLTIAPLDEESIVSPEWLKPRVNAFQEEQSKSIKPDGSDSTGISRDDAKIAIALIDENQLDCVKQQRVDDICNPSVAAASATEGTSSNKKEVTCSKEDMDAQSGMPLFAASFDFDDSACTPAPSDEGSRDVGNTIVVEKAILASPSRTFASSDDSSQGQGDEEAGVFDRPVDVEDESRNRKMIAMTMGCCIIFLIVIVPVLVFVGQQQKRSDISATVAMDIPETMSPSTSSEPSSSPSNKPSISPIMTPSSIPSFLPTVTTEPTSTPSAHPSISTQPSAFPSTAPFVLFTYGESLYTDNDLDIQISVGLTAKQIAQTGSRVSYANGGQSSISYHDAMDGAGIAPLPDGGYAYLSNAEKSSGAGGVYGLYFDKDGQITDYKALLTGTSRNCGGGMSPWNTWISCEETGGGQCWQIEPDPNKPNHNSPKATRLGGPNGGEYETVAVDNTNKNKPVFFVTEDESDGELRRFEADGNGWDALHVGGRTTYLEFLDGNRFQWTTSLIAGENSAASYYPNAEGIIYHNSTLYFVAKVTRTLFILDLNDMTYTSEQTGSSWVGQGSFNSQPDQIIESDLDKRKYIYFTEDGGSAPGVHVRDREGKYYTMVRGVPGGRYSGDETVGIAFSPDRRKFYFGFQDAGVLMEVTRDDGHVFN